MKEAKDRSALPFDKLTALSNVEGLPTGDGRGPYPLAPGPARRPTRALRDAALDHHEEQGLLSQVKHLKLREAAPDGNVSPPDKPGELRPSVIATIKSQSKSLNCADAGLRNHCNRLLSREEADLVRKEFVRYGIIK